VRTDRCPFCLGPTEPYPAAEDGYVICTNCGAGGTPQKWVKTIVIRARSEDD
jgi:hypothetical protein